MGTNGRPHGLEVGRLAEVDITTPAFKTDPFGFYARLRAEAPVQPVRWGRGRTAWLVTRHDDVERVLRDPRLGKNREDARTPAQQARGPRVPTLFASLQRGLLSLDGPDHDRLRRLVHQAFTPRRIERMREEVQVLADGLLDAAERRGSMDLIADYAAPLPLIVIARIIGLPALALLEHPAELERLRADDGIVGPAVEELLRFTSPVETATERWAATDVAVAGVTIPQGSLVLAVLASANRDPSVFAQPDALDLTRSPNPHLAFGKGAHYCLGAPLARLEARIALPTLLRRAPGLRRADPDAPVAWRGGAIVRGLTTLPVLL